MTSEYVKLPELPEGYYFDIQFHGQGTLYVAVMREAGLYDEPEEVSHASRVRSTDVLRTAETLAENIKNGLPYVGVYKE